MAMGKRTSKQAPMFVAATAELEEILAR